MAFNVETATTSIINSVGGTDNIISVTHCVTRLRFILKDNEKVDNDKLKSTEGVLDVIYAAGQCQIVLAQNLFPVYDKIINDYEINTEDAVDENHEEDLKLTIKQDTKKVLSII